MVAIKAEKLVHIYKEHLWQKPKVALDGLSLEVNEGQIFGYLGSNGAGKTTTIKILVGLHYPNSGHAEIFGQNVKGVEARRLVGFQPENPYFYEYLTALETLYFYAGLCDMPRQEYLSRSEELLEFIGLKEARDVRVKEFSKGMRQRLGIAQSIIHRPKLVILDEPMSGLDPVGRMQVREAILSLKEQGMTVFFSSHVLGDVEMICDQAGLLMGGKLVACGTIDQLLAKSHTRYEVVCTGLKPDKKEKLAAKAIEKNEKAEEYFCVYEEHKDAEEAVKLILDNGGILKMMRPQRESLEEYFMRTTGKSREEVGAWSGGSDK